MEESKLCILVVDRFQDCPLKISVKIVQTSLIPKFFKGEGASFWFSAVAEVATARIA
jgi:hypothetical protein